MSTKKLRRIGNSLGTTFSKELLQQAGFSGDEELQITAAPGEIRIRSATKILVELSRAEADALATGNLASKPAAAALNKIQTQVAGQKATRKKNT